MRNGLGGLLVVGALVYFTGAGGWVMERAQKLDANCYGVLADLGESVANPVCNGLAGGMQAIQNISASVSHTVSEWRDRLLNTGDLNRLNEYVSGFEQRVASFSSSKEQLTQLIQQGPSALNGQSLTQQFQQAVDSFAIGQLYLKDGNNSAAMPWLQQGASQQGGFGLMSQLTLGNMYAQGGQGVARDPQAATQYLIQAQQSLGQLSAGNTQQSQLLLQSLPVPPQQLRQQIEQAIQQLRVVSK